MKAVELIAAFFIPPKTASASIFLLKKSLGRYEGSYPMTRSLTTRHPTGSSGWAPVRSRPFPPHPIIGKKRKKSCHGRLEQRPALRISYDFLGGPSVRAFERKFADYFGMKHGIAVNSGTAALHVALAAAGVGPGDEVIVPCYTFTATATAVLHQQGTPVFIDVDPKTFCVTADLIKAVHHPANKSGDPGAPPRQCLLRWTASSHWHASII